jgi:uncharacterized protein YecT (DUF1311 family)
MNNNIKRGGLVAATLLGCLGLAVSAQGASFDCGKASTKAERLICDNPYISELDDKLSAAYKAALKNKQQANAIRAAQRDWLEVRNECEDALCLLSSYEDRLKALGVGNIYPDRTEKPSERQRYFIDHESEFIEDESENRPFCRALLDALIKTKPSPDHLVCTDEVLFKLPGVSDPAWVKLDLSKHEELVKKILTVSEVGSDEYFRKKKIMPERYPTPEKQQSYLVNIMRQGAELFMMHLPPEFYGDLVLVTLRMKDTACGRPVGGNGEYANGAWVTPDLKEIAYADGGFNPHAGRPLTYRGRLYLASAGSDAVDIKIPGRRATGSVCSISLITD